MHKRYKVLISAYACSPYRGSEPGMGWNFIKELSKHHEIHVITEEYEFKPDIEEYLHENPDYKKIKFHYIPRVHNKLLRKIWPPSYYWYYKNWQKHAFKFAKRLDEIENFHIIHQLNMVGYREPGFLWKIEKPYVWGPIGGLKNVPWRFLPYLGAFSCLYFTFKNFYNSFQRKYMSRPRKAAQRKNAALIAATPTIKKLIRKKWGKDSIVISEVGREANFNLTINNRINNEPLKIIWSGLHIPRKNLPLLLKSLEKIKFPYELHILGAGEMTKKWKRLAGNLGIQDQCIWHGWIKKDEALKIMSNGHVFCITSINDLSSTVTLEALSVALPVICLDHCGFSHIINEDCGIKIPVNTPHKAELNFSKALESLLDEKFRQKLSRGAIRRAKDFSWNKKIDKLNSIYQSLLIEANE